MKQILTLLLILTPSLLATRTGEFAVSGDSLLLPVGCFWKTKL